MKINEMRDQAHAQAVKSGWWDAGDVNPLQVHMLIVSEVAEATEEARKGTPPVYLERQNSVDVLTGKHPLALPDTDEWKQTEKAGFSKPEGELIELADVLIRIGDYCGRMGWDLEAAVKMKMAFNSTRSRRHGGKKY